MALSDPKAFGVPSRRLRNVSISTEHVSLAVASGDVVEVTDDLAAQLQATSGAFVEVGSPREKAAVAGLVEIAAAAEPEAEPVAEPVKPEPVAVPVSKTAARKAARSAK